MKTNPTIFRAVRLLMILTLLPVVIPTAAEIIPLNTGTAAQSTTLSSFVATNALDTVNNFTHTSGSDTNATWQVLLPEVYTFNEVVAFGRTSCCQTRFRDITIEIIDFTGDVTTDFSGGTVTFTSGLPQS